MATETKMRMCPDCKGLVDKCPLCKGVGLIQSNLPAPPTRTEEPRRLNDEERELAERMPVAMVEQCREQPIPDLEIIERVAGYVQLSFDRLAFLEAERERQRTQIDGMRTLINDVAKVRPFTDAGCCKGCEMFEGEPHLPSCIFLRAKSFPPERP